ncbi:MAG: type VI secretion system baseplate subunit TssG [Acidobacteriia bacterium]|nr:type VI secretion system baseplate subunit TssG [Terriglobia bacterium]
MAAPGRRTGSSLEEALFARGCEFDFFQAVRLLARLAPQRAPVGNSGRPADETARFGAQLTTAFPASAVHEIVPPEDGGPPRVMVAFLGLTGTQGVLPLFYTERMLARRAARDNAMAAFFDIFNHRFVSLFYRAWEKHRPAELYELAAVRDRRPDAFTQYLFDLIGMGTAGLRGRMRAPDEGLLFYAGLIAQRPRSASALRGVLQDYFSVPVEIEQCIGSWYDLEEADRCYLSPELERSQLGEGAFLGDQIWNQQARFRIRVGPLGFDRFREFLPDGGALGRLRELTRFLTGRAMVFEVQVVLRAGEVPPCRLDDSGSDAPRLGWMGWLKAGEFAADAGEAVFTYTD